MLVRSPWRPDRRGSRLTLALGVLVAGCSGPHAGGVATSVPSASAAAASTSAETGAPPPTAVPSGDPGARPTASAPGPGADATVGLVTTEPLVRPETLGGSVHSRRTSEDLPPDLDATVTVVRSVPRGDAVVDWDVGLRAPAGQEHHLYVFAPSGLPVPVRSGDAVHVRTRRTGGGPNLRYAIEVRAAGGPLLLAVNAVPSDWAVTRGTAAGKTPMAGYDQQDYGVVFEHAGQRLEPAYASWAVLTAGPRSYYLWGHAAERTLHPGKAPMPDYVGDWLDFAIVMAR